MSNASLVKIATYDNPIYAHLARNQLETANLPVFLDGEHHVAMDWMIANAVGGIKLLVPAEHRDEAIRILDETATVDSAPDMGNRARADETGAEIACPECGSHETYREKLRRKLIYLSILLLGIPLPFLSRRLACDTCGHAWNPAGS